MGAEKRIEVIIDGIPVTLLSDENEEYIRQLEIYLNEKLKQLKSKHRFLTTHMLVALLGLNLADDYFKEKQKKTEDTEDRRRAARLQNENEDLKKKIALLQEELELKGEVLKENFAFKDMLEQRQDEINTKTERIAVLEKELENNRKELVNKTEKITALEKESGNNQSDMDAKMERISSLEKELENSRNELDEYIRVFDERK